MAHWANRSQNVSSGLAPHIGRLGARFASTQSDENILFMDVWVCITHWQALGALCNHFIYGPVGGPTSSLWLGIGLKMNRSVVAPFLTFALNLEWAPL